MFNSLFSLFLLHIHCLKMGKTITMGSISNSPTHTHKFFLLTNYILIGAATSCIFLTLSLRLIPSLIGFFLIFLHLLTIILSIFSCSSSSSSSSSSSARCHALNMAATVFIALFQGAVALLVFSNTTGFLQKMRSYVQEDDGVVILRMVGVLGLVMFVFEWVALVLAFVMRFYVYVDGVGASSSNKVGQEQIKKGWLPFEDV